MGLFNSVRIQTPESVELEFVLAGIGSRAVALLVDYILLSTGLLLLLWLGIFLSTQLSQWDVLLSIDTDTLQLWVFAIIGLVIFAAYVGYFVGFETAWYGQTPGKRYARIRVVRDDGQPMRLFQATLRSLLRPVDDILFIGFFFIVLGQQEKRIGDWLAGTLVVQTDPRKPGKGITVSEEAKRAGARLLEHMDFERISPDDFSTVRAYLQRRDMLTEAARVDVASKLAQGLKKKTELAEWPGDVTTEIFLEAVYWSYQERK